MKFVIDEINGFKKTCILHGTLLGGWSNGTLVYVFFVSLAKEQ